jgi:hypothetical protein
LTKFTLCEVSAFVTPDGLFQYKVMPFGMRNAPATFQRMINNVIKGLDCCAAYIDDLIVCSDSFEDHLSHLYDISPILRKSLTKRNVLSDLGTRREGELQSLLLGSIISLSNIY